MASDTTTPGQITILLGRWSGGDEQALEDLIPLVYARLRELAGCFLVGERPGHILQPTALVNEAYMRLAAQDEKVWQNRSHFFAVAAHIMRNILVDYARQHRRHKRGGGVQIVSLESVSPAAVENPEYVLLFDQALTRLAKEHPRKARLVELHSFGGLTLAEAAEFLHISENTAQRDWKFTKAWMTRELGHHRECKDQSRTD
jgi:RNA polymerase sigma factor (TIGR02999 family)